MNEDVKKELTAEERHVMWEKGTERPFTGKYWDAKDKGMYRCKSCGNELFSSNVKFDSGTGWPSFSETKKGNVNYSEDTSHGMRRVEVTCAKCGAHLGHVFDDGPGPEGKRYCINSVCLDLDKNIDK